MGDPVGPGSQFTGHAPDTPGMPRGYMTHVRLTALQALDQYPGQSFSDRVHTVAARLEHYRAGLARIADAESGPWGDLAREYLDGAPDA